MIAVSIIIPAYLSHETIEATLTTVAPQVSGVGEIVVVDTSPDERTAEAVARTPAVRLLRPQRRMWPHEARGYGVKAADPASRLVFTDPDCRAHDGWLDALLAALDDGADIVLGPTRAEATGGWRARGVHRAKYSMWASSAAPPPGVTSIPSSNYAIEREAWTRIGGYTGDRWHGDTQFGWRAAELGLNVAFAPRASVEHVAEPSLRRFVREREDRGRSFAAMRAAESGWSRRHALARALATPVVPPVLLVRSLRHAARAGELSDVVRTAPVLLLGFGAWAVGEAKAFAGAARR